MPVCRWAPACDQRQFLDTGLFEPARLVAVKCWPQHALDFQGGNLCPANRTRTRHFFHQPPWPKRRLTASLCRISKSQTNTTDRSYPPSTGHRHLQYPISRPHGARELLLAITHSSDLDSLLELLSANEHRLNLRHLDATLGRLARFGGSSNADSTGTTRSPPDRASHAPTSNRSARRARYTANRLLSIVLPRHEAELSARDCASLLASLARLAPAPSPNTAPPPPAPPAARLLAYRLLSDLGRAASLRDRVALLHAAARLRLALPGRALVGLLAGMEAELGQAGKPQDVSMTLWALASMGLAPPPGWLRRLTAALPAPRLAGFGCQALSNTAWALAKMGFRPRPEWLAALVAASGPLLKACTSQELVNLLWALAVLRHRPPAAWLQEALRLLHQRAAVLTAQDVSNACWSLAVLHVRPGLSLLQRLVARALAVRRDMTPQGLVMTLWGLAQLRVVLPERAVALMLQGGLGAAALLGAGAGPGANGTGAGAPAAAAVATAEQAGRRPPARDGVSRGSAAGAGARAGPSELAGAALVLGRCRHVPTRRWLTRYYAAVTRQLERFGPRELSTLLYGLALLRLRPDPRWLDRLLAEVERHAAADLAEAAAGAPAEQQQQQQQQGPAPPTASTTFLALVFAESSSNLTGGSESDRGDGSSRSLASPIALIGPPNAPDQQLEQQDQRQQHELVAGLAEGVFLRPPPEGRSGVERGRGAGPRERVDPQQVAVVLWAVAELGHAPTEAWLRTMIRLVAARLEDFESPEAAITVRALQQLAAAATRRAPRPRMRGRRGAGASGTSSSNFTPSAAAGGGGASTAESCRALVGQLVTRLAGSLPDRSLYGTLRAASLVSGPSYATLADQVLLDVYSVRSLRLLRGGGAATRGGGGEEEEGGEGNVGTAGIAGQSGELA